MDTCLDDRRRLDSVRALAHRYRADSRNSLTRSRAQDLVRRWQHAPTPPAVQAVYRRQRQQQHAGQRQCEAALLELADAAQLLRPRGPRPEEQIGPGLEALALAGEQLLALQAALAEDLRTLDGQLAPLVRYARQLERALGEARQLVAEQLQHSRAQLSRQPLTALRQRTAIVTLLELQQALAGAQAALERLDPAAWREVAFRRPLAGQHQADAPLPQLHARLEELQLPAQGERLFLHLEELQLELVRSVLEQQQRMRFLQELWQALGGDPQPFAELAETDVLALA